MKIILYDEYLRALCFPITDFPSLQLEESWTEPGTWKLVLPPASRELLNGAAYISTPVFDGVVDETGISNDVFTLSGRTLEAVLDDYTLKKTVLSGKAEDAARGLVRQNAPDLLLEDANGYAAMIASSAEEGSLLNALYACLNPRGLSPKLTIDHEANRLKFGVRRGLNRTSMQSVNNWAIFSESRGNLDDPQLVKNVKDEKNYIVVKAGDDEVPEYYNYDFRGVL